MKLIRNLKLLLFKLVFNCFPRFIRGKVLKYLADAYRFKSSYFASIMRSFLLEEMGAAIGKSVVIKPGVYIEFPEKLKLGHNVSIQHNCFLSAFGGLEIGNDVSIANGTSIITSTHKFKAVSIIRNEPIVCEPVKIGNNVWIGMKSCILSGVDIGSNTVIGAGSVVVRNVPDNSLAYGVPANVKKQLRRQCE